MSEKQNAIFTTGIVLAILLIFGVAGLFTKRSVDPGKSEALATVPVPAREEILAGSFSAGVENYLSERFVNREKWSRIRKQIDIALQKKEIDGIYLGSDDYLFEKKDPRIYSRELQEERLADLKMLVRHWKARVMLVPSAETVLAEKMPAYAESFDENGFLELARETLGSYSYIDVYDMLKGHDAEEIFYRTDPCWTTLGAYYGYLAWADSTNRVPYAFDTVDMETVTAEYRGNLQQRLGVPWEADTIQYFPETKMRPVEVIYDQKRKEETMYAADRLESADAYDFFLEGNRGVMLVDTVMQNGRSLFLIKDSFANCMIPLLTYHYEKIYVVDLRYFEGDLLSYMESCKPEKGMEVLVLYNCAEFLKTFEY